MDDRELKETTDEVNAKSPVWIVRIKVSYRDAYFEFKTPQEACEFMTIAASSNVKGDDEVKIEMYVKREEEEE